MNEVAEPDFVVDNRPAARRSLRIAVVTETYPPEVNGVALTLERMVDGLRARNHAVQLIRPRQKQSDEADRGDSGDVLLAGVPIPRYSQLRMGLPSTGALISLWSRQRPDVVHIATEGPLGWSAVRAAARLKLPAASDFRTNFQTYSQHYGVGWLRKPIEAYLRKFHNRTQCTTVPTDELRVQLGGLGFRNLRVIPRGVDARRFDPAKRNEDLRHAWGAGPRTLVTLCVSRLAAEKNLPLLIDAYTAIRARVADSRLVIVGEGPMRRELGRLCPDAHFAGMRRGEDLAVHFASADLFAFPSLSETFGNVTTEAMASGLAIVAFRHAAAGRLIEHGVSGWLAEPGDRADFLRCAVQAGVDAAERGRRGSRARALAEQLDWECVLDQIDTMLAAAAASAQLPENAVGWRTVKS